jgi:hypothetical protein
MRDSQQGPLIANAYCQKCGKSYPVTSDDMVIVPGMRLNPPHRSTPKPIPKTWADWLDHVNAYCADCRFCRPPSQCRADLQRHLDRYLDEIRVDPNAKDQ